MPISAPPADAGSPSMLRSIGRNLVWMLASRGVMAVLSLFYLGIVTRSLGVVGFGRFALINGASQTLATLVAFQSWQVIVQYGIGPQERGDRGALGRLFRTTLLVDAIGAVAGALLAWAILEIWGDALGIGATLKRATLIFSIVELITVRSTAIGILRLRDKFSLAAVADSVTPVARFVGAIGVAFVHPTVQGFLFAWGAAEVLTAMAFWIMVWRLGDLALLRRARGVRRLVQDNPGIVRFALSTNASSTLNLASKQLPLLLVGAVAGPAAAGVFRLAAQLAQALAKIAQLLSRAAFPEVVKIVAGASPARLGQLLRRLFLGSGITSAAIMAIVLAVGRPVLNLVGGHAFASGWPVMLWLTVAGCLDLATVGVDTVLTALQRAGTVFALRAVGVAALFVAAAMLVPLYGTVGVAMAVAAGSAGVALLMALAAMRLARERVPPQ